MLLKRIRMVHFYIPFETFASSAIQGPIFLKKSMHFLKKKQMRQFNLNCRIYQFIFRLVESFFSYFLTLSLIHGSFPPTFSISASKTDNVCVSSISNPLVTFLSLTSPFKSPMAISILSPNSILS